VSIGVFFLMLATKSTASMPGTFWDVPDDPREGHHQDTPRWRNGPDAHFVPKWNFSSLPMRDTLESPVVPPPIPSAQEGGDVGADTTTDMDTDTDTDTITTPDLKIDEVEDVSPSGAKGKENALPQTPEDTRTLTSSDQATSDEVPRWKGKGKAVVSLQDIRTPSTAEASPGATIAEVWKKYEPPQALSNVPDTEADAIKQIVDESIAKIKTRIAEEEARRQAEAEAERVRREDADCAKEIVVDVSEPPLEDAITKTVSKDSSLHSLYSHIARPAAFAGVPMVLDDNGLLRPITPPKAKKRSWKALLRRFNISERGESSRAGAARQRLAPSPDSIELLYGRKRAATRSSVGSISSPRVSVHEETV
jgi:hypothetical protein